MTSEFQTWLRMHCVCFPTVGDHFKKLNEQDRHMLEGVWAKSLGGVRINILERASQILMEHNSKFRIMFDQHIGKILEISGNLQERGTSWKNEKLWERQAPLSECTKACNYWTRLFHSHALTKSQWVESIIDEAVKHQDEGWYKTASAMEEGLVEKKEPTKDIVAMAKVG